MADIFISYSQKDRARVKRLVDALSVEGYKVWWDLDIRAGESFDQLIEATLKRVRCVVAVWSRHSVKSEWVRAESAWAKDRNRLVSIRIDEGLELPLKFYHVHTKSMTLWDGARDDPRFRKLVADIVQIAGPPPSPASAPRAAAALSPGRRAVSAPEHEAVPEPPSPPRSSAEPKDRAASRPSSQPGPAPTEPEQRPGSGRRAAGVRSRAWSEPACPRRR